jgi:hypothetical protein
MKAEFSREQDGNTITVQFEGPQLSRNDQKRLQDQMEDFLKSLKPNKNRLREPLTE